MNVREFPVDGRGLIVDFNEPKGSGADAAHTRRGSLYATLYVAGMREISLKVLADCRVM